MLYIKGNVYTKKLFYVVAEQIKWCTNYNLTDIVTPVNADKLHELLTLAHYDEQKTAYLADGFKNGFSLCYQKQVVGSRFAPNLTLRVGSKIQLWNKVMAEVELGRYAGPYETPPFKDFIQSPIGLVPKDHGKKTRLIFHLSYPKGGTTSVNAGIPKDLCKVKYPDFEEAVKLCLEAGKFAKMGKSDMSAAFRQAPLKVGQFNLMVMMAKHPENGQVYYFVDKCLPFGCSISPAIFQEISNGIAFLVTYRTKKPTVNYLDDYFFAALLKSLCDWQVNHFIQLCREINFPISIEKTFWGTGQLVFLGFLLDTNRQIVCIPIEKIQKALELIEFFLNKKKVTVLQVQRLCGYLNFLCRCIAPGRAFTRRLYAMYTGSKGQVLLPHHHVNVKSENKTDLIIWRDFLKHPNIFCRPFTDYRMVTSDDILMYSDASGNYRKCGFGAWCQTSYMYSTWEADFVTRVKPSIEYLELFGVTAGILTWIHRFTNRHVTLFCDNKSVRDMINGSSARCKNCMYLIRLIVIKSLKHNVQVSVKYVESKKNDFADALSRMETKRIEKLKLKYNIERYPTRIPNEIWPMSKIWLY